MKKTTRKPLTINRETLRLLSDEGLRKAHGGVFTTQTVSCARSCEMRCWSDGIC